MVQCNSEDLRTEVQSQSWGKKGMKRQTAQSKSQDKGVSSLSFGCSFDQVLSRYLKLKVYVKCLPGSPAVEERCKKVGNKTPLFNYPFMP